MAEIVPVNFLHYKAVLSSSFFMLRSSEDIPFVQTALKDEELHSISLRAEYVQK